MQCPKSGAKMRKRTFEPYGITEPITVYRCVSALCEYDEDDDPRRWVLLSSRPR
jgi:hypothetical protein